MIDVMPIAPGTRLSLKGGATAEVVENMHDGQWLMVRYLTGPDISLIDEEELVHASDVIAIDAG